MKMKRIGILLVALFFIAAVGAAMADSVTSMHYVYHNWVGEYTGQVDTNKVPFGYGLFVSSVPMGNELWHYIGRWENGLPEGEGAIYSEDGTMRKGFFSQGELINGYIFSANGLSVETVKQERATTSSDVLYIGNKKSMRFHYPTCRSVSQMSEKNKVEFTSREEAIERHYIPCGDCNP